MLMSQAASNSYSPSWFEFFHVGIGQSRTSKEINFICACAPLPDFRKVLDLCCGMGRHARALVKRGYTVTGVERDAAAVRKARESGGGPDYIETDVRNYQPDKETYDLAIVMSQSFGYFDAATNHEFLGRVASGIRKGGRVILDLWNPEFFATHQGEREFETASGVVLERKQVKHGRLRLRLTYPDGAKDDFEWQLFAPSEMRALAESVGLSLVVTCTYFDAAICASPENPRIQFLLQKQK
jgi:SAM-dependent methyltransferase